MKRLLIAVVLVASILSGCAQSVVNDVTVSNVEKESYRPEGYVLTGDLGKDGFAWDGVIISCDVTNNSNRTIKVSVVVKSYCGSRSVFGESNPVSIDPGETRRAEYDFNYAEQDIEATWLHDISDVILK